MLLQVWLVILKPTKQGGNAMAEQKEEYAAIEELKTRQETSDAVFEGVKAANGWKTGKMVTEKVYQDAVNAFGKAPMDGREVRKNVQ